MLQFRVTEKASLLADLLSKAMKFAARDFDSVCSGVLLTASKGSLIVTATDTSAGLKIETECKTVGDGRILIPAKQVHDLVATFKGDTEITLKAEERSITVSAGRSEFSFAALDTASFPEVDFDLSAPGTQVPLDSLRESISAVRYAAARPDSAINPLLEGVNFVLSGDKLSACATDNARLATQSISVVKQGGDIEAVLHQRVVEVLGQMSGDTVSVHPQPRRILFTDGKIVGFAQRIEGNYPDVKAVLPNTHEVQLKVKADALLSALKRAQVITDLSHYVEVSVSDSGFGISARSEMGRCSEVVEAASDYLKPFKTGVNCRYLVDAISHLQDPSTVSIKFSGESKPIIIEPESGETMSIVVPMKPAASTAA